MSQQIILYRLIEHGMLIPPNQPASSSVGSSTNETNNAESSVAKVLPANSATSSGASGRLMLFFN